MEDDELQQRLLNKLNEYGDSLLNEKDYSRQVSSEKHQTTQERRKKKSAIPTGLKDSTTRNGKRKTKKGKKLEEAVTAPKKRKYESFDDELREFQKDEIERKNEERMDEQRRTMRAAPEVVVFQDPSRRKEKQVYQRQQQERNEDEFNLKTARYEVRQFGLSGFSFKHREKCEAERAISLGAWAPKKAYINYKEFTQQQKAKKEDERKQREVDRKMGYNVTTKRSTATPVRVKNQGFWRDSTQDKKFFLDGQIGRYKHGVQVVSQEEIGRVKSRKGRGGKTNRNVNHKTIR